MIRSVLVFGLVSAAFVPPALGARPECRPSTAPDSCKPHNPHEIHTFGWPPWNDAFLEGDGLETLHFNVDGGNNVLPSVGPLQSFSSCGGRAATDQKKAAPGELFVQSIRCSAEARGVAACTVTIAVTDRETGPPKTVCGQSADKDNKYTAGVLMVRGYWDGSGAWVPDPNSVTLSCAAEAGPRQYPQADGAITTCIEANYYPGTERDEFLACIRAVRADYCGDGFPRTLGGTLMRLHDDQLNKMRTAECSDYNLDYEASWSKDGAVRVYHDRWTGDEKGQRQGEGMELEVACHEKFKTCPHDRHNPLDGKSKKTDDPPPWCRIPSSSVDTKAVVFTRTQCNQCPPNPDSKAVCPAPVHLEEKCKEGKAGAATVKSPKASSGRP